ncbi:alpha/beta hydrolase [Paenibacillus sp. CAA11]|uniref:alpha/beta fold hydrolase n=1 Tax=Paenibacillus sp. CAA11 TaxID=1532905 RepID=UPI000D3DB9E6|nr:alpha/beta hydrolase [Paenibacillus sp. CAA11]AWB43455.1 alpha/beta hydrolase [Paenibacillus sp. CAA11]
MIALFLIAAVIAALYLYGQYRFRAQEEQYPPTGQFVTAEGTKLHYISKGAGRPIVFLHGGVLDGHDFDHVLERAASSGFRGIAFDRPGYGYSERPQNERVTPMTQARLLHQALSVLDIEKPILVAHSWSGVLVMAYALEYPEEVSGIVTLGAGLYPEGYPAEQGDPISSLVTTPVLGSAVMNTMLAVLGPPLANNMLKETFKPEEVPEGYREAVHALWLRPSQFRANREDVLAFVPAAKALMGRYKEIRVPLVIVIGAEDPFETKEHSFRLHQELPHSRLIVLPQAAHMIPHNHPDAVMRAVQEVVASDSDSSG